MAAGDGTDRRLRAERPALRPGFTGSAGERVASAGVEPTVVRGGNVIDTWRPRRVGRERACNCAFVYVFWRSWTERSCAMRRVASSARCATALRIRKISGIANASTTSAVMPTTSSRMRRRISASVAGATSRTPTPRTLCR